MPLAKHKTVRQALEYVVRHPQWPDEDLTSRLEMPIWELIGRQLFDIANFPDMKVVGSVNKATRAQRIILDRTAGTRRMGTNPAVQNANRLEMVDLTQGMLPTPEEDEDVED